MKYTQFSEKTAQKTVLDMVTGADYGNREVLRYTWTDAAGRVCAIDGFRGFRIAAPLEGLPTMPEHLTPIDIDRIWPVMGDGLRELERPDLREVDALIAYDRRHAGLDRYLYKFGAGLPAVNAIYLRDALRVFPDARIYCKNSVSPVLFMSAHGDAIVLPVRVADEKRGRRKVIWSLSAFAARFGA